MSSLSWYFLYKNPAIKDSTATSTVIGSGKNTVNDRPFLFYFVAKLGSLLLIDRDVP